MLENKNYSNKDMFLYLIFRMIFQLGILLISPFLIIYILIMYLVKKE